MDNTTNSNSIYSILQNEIINLIIKPGEILSENELCARFNVSRTPIRSVLQRLESNGFVTITPYVGTMVTLLDFDIISQLIYQRIAIEGAVIRDFMAICDPPILEKIRYNVQSSEILISGDFKMEQFYKLDSKLHEIWFKETKKLYLWDSIQKAHSHYSRFRILDYVEVRNFEQIVEEHKELIELIVLKDKDSVEQKLKKHLYGGITRLGGRIYSDLTDYFVKE